MRELVTLLTDHGVLIVFAAILAARVGAPVPASPLLVVAGGLAGAGSLSWLVATLASIAANVIGDAVWFQAGRRYGHRVMRVLCRISLSPDSCVRQSESLIARWGGGSLIAAKFVPGVSVVAAPMAGALHMPWPRFLGFELLASAIWTSLFLGLGAAFSQQIQLVLDVMASTGVVASAMLAAVLAGMIGVRYWRRRSALSEAGMARITVDELHALMRDGLEPLIIDVRSPASAHIDARRIPGAIAIPLTEIDLRAPDLSRDREIVLYCNCPNEVSAARAARRLMTHGIQRVRPLTGGLDAWVASGRSVDGSVSGAANDAAIAHTA